VADYRFGGADVLCARGRGRARREPKRAPVGTYHQALEMVAPYRRFLIG